MVSPNDFPAVETVIKKIVKEKQPFERLEIKKEDLLKMFEVLIFTIVHVFICTKFKFFHFLKYFSLIILLEFCNMNELYFSVQQVQAEATKWEGHHPFYHCVQVGISKYNVFLYLWLKQWQSCKNFVASKQWMLSVCYVQDAAHW